MKKLISTFILFITFYSNEFANKMIRVAQEMEYVNDWKDALEHAKDTYVPIGKQSEEITKLLEQSLKFIEDRDLITITEMAKES
ncbi:hypothetical protein ACG2LH_12420 [Zhouia sp. PK063]|uniref:hypothetical protein n=1 Tax=Zhouia sp. PK063 TaxID=3373602 RepID=UPI003788CEBD